MKRKAAPTLTPEQAVQFLEDMRTLGTQLDEPTKMISIRIPENILRALRTKARADGKRYQSLIIEILREGLKRRDL